MSLLSGIRVIDLTRNLAGPFCTMLLADLGAEVIKVEMPGTGDEARTFGPFINGESGYFISINRGKKGITLNLKDPRGKELLLKLVARGDVLVESFRPGVLERLGLSYERVSAVNPRIVYASVSGFGHTGPYREKGAYDLVVQGYGGIMSITGQPGGVPTRVGVSIGDLAAGLYLASGILAALVARGLTGRGDRIDVSMLDCQVALLENSIVRYGASGEIPGRIGNRHPSITPFEMFPTQDGYIIVCAGNQNLWENFCRVIGREDLLADPRFASNGLRTDNQAALAEILQGVMVKKSTAEWLELLDAAGVPCGPVNNVAQVLKDPQVRSREMVITIDHPRAGQVQVPGCPVKAREHPPVAAKPSPLLGEHNREVFGWLGLSEADLAELEREGVI